MCCWIWFASILLRIFASMFINIGLKFSFLLYLCQVLVSGWCWPHRISCGGDASPQFFRMVSVGIILALLCTSGRIRLWIHQVLKFFWLVGYLLWIRFQSSLFVCSGNPFLLGSVLGGCMGAGIYSSLLTFLVCVCRSVHSSFWWWLLFLWGP